MELEQNGFLQRIYCSISLSLSDSSMFGGGGCRSSFGLYIELDLTFPIDLMVFDSPSKLQLKHSHSRVD